jgi:hypothetical protein
MTDERNDAVGRAVADAFGLTRVGEFWQTDRGPKRTAALGAMIFDLIREACPAQPGPVDVDALCLSEKDAVAVRMILEAANDNGTKLRQIAVGFMKAPIECVSRDNGDWFSYIKLASLSYTTLILDPVHGLKTGSYFAEMNARGWADFDLTRIEVDG